MTTIYPKYCVQPFFPGDIFNILIMKKSSQIDTTDFVYIMQGTINSILKGKCDQNEIIHAIKKNLLFLFD
jgi:hypothetical protein